MKIRCISCKTEHELTTKKFPLEARKLINKETGESSTEGYFCKKCIAKQQRNNLIKKYNIRPSGNGKTINQMIKEALELNGD